MDAAVARFAFRVRFFPRRAHRHPVGGCTFAGLLLQQTWQENGLWTFYRLMRLFVRQRPPVPHGLTSLLFRCAALCRFFGSLHPFPLTDVRSYFHTSWSVLDAAPFETPPRRVRFSPFSAEGWELRYAF